MVNIFHINHWRFTKNASNGENKVAVSETCSVGALCFMKKYLRFFSNDNRTKFFSINMQFPGNDTFFSRKNTKQDKICIFRTKKRNFLEFIEIAR